MMGGSLAQKASLSKRMSSTPPPPPPSASPGVGSSGPPPGDFAQAPSIAPRTTAEKQSSRLVRMAGLYNGPEAGESATDPPTGPPGCQTRGGGMALGPPRARLDRRPRDVRMVCPVTIFNIGKNVLRTRPAQAPQHLLHRSAARRLPAGARARPGRAGGRSSPGGRRGSSMRATAASSRRRPCAPTRGFAGSSHSRRATICTRSLPPSPETSGPSGRWAPSFTGKAADGRRRWARRRPA